MYETTPQVQEPAARDDADHPTVLWNDSASIQELTYALDHGAVGATRKPVIVCDVLRKEMPLWRERIERMIEGMLFAIEEQIAWKIVEEISIKGAKPFSSRTEVLTAFFSYLVANDYSG